VKCYKDSLKENLKKSGFLLKALCEEPLDGDSWRSECREATAKFEASHVAALEMKQLASRLHYQAWMSPSGHAADVPGSALLELDSSSTEAHTQ